MPFRVTCPGCQTACVVPDEMVGQKVRCKQCSNIFQVAAKTKSPGPLPASPPLAPRAAAPPRTPKAPPKEEPPVLEWLEEVPSDGLQAAPNPRPLAKKKLAAARPLVRSRGRVSPPRSHATFWAVAAVAALLLVGGGVGLAFFLSDKDEAKTTPTADAGNDKKDKADPTEKKPEGGAEKKPENRVPEAEKKPTDPVPFPPVVEVQPVDPVPPPPVVEQRPADPVPPPPVVEIKPADPVPPPPVVDIKSPAIERDKIVRTLPSAATDAVVGGGGRYLILHLPQLRKLAVFDVSAARIKGYVSAAADHIKFAAGLDKLFVALPDDNILQRWDLHTLKREVTVPLPGTGKVHLLALGSAAQGPLLVASTDGFRAPTSFLDTRTLKPLNLRTARGEVPGVAAETFVRVSADGRVFGLWNPNVSPQGVQTWVLAGGEIQVHGNGDSCGHVAPGPDGKVVYTGRGLFTNQARRIGKLDTPGGVYCVPPVEGNFYLSVTPPAAHLHFVGETRPLLTLKDVELPRGINQWGREPFGGDRRILLIPSAKVLITLPDTNDRVVLHRLDLDAALDKSGVDYLFVTSSPPVAARKGTLLSYPLTVKSRQGGITYKLDAGPKGMSISPAGLLRWQVPADFAEQEADVIVSVGDKTGQEVFHTFKLAVGGAAADVPPRDLPRVVEKPPQPVDPPVKEPASRPVESRPDEPAGPSAAGIKPPPLDKAVVERPLPSAVSSVVVGGGGRYLILHLPREQKLAVFDANEGKVTRYIPVADDGVLFAAGMDKLMVVLPSSHILQRWSLTSGKREVTTKFPIKGVVRRLCMGSASRGPLLVGGEDGPVAGALFLDIRTLKPIRYQMAGLGRVGFDAGTFIRASADGKVFGFWHPNVSPQGLATLVLSGTTVSLFSDHVSVGHVVPGPDGKTLYTARGTYTSQTKAIGKSEPNGGVYTLPAAHGDYCMTLEINRAGGLRTRSVVSVQLVGEPRAIATLPEIELPDNLNQWDREPLSTDMRLHLIPAAKLLVVLAPTNDKLVVHRFDPEAALKKSGIDYLIVTSKPPTAARRGQLYHYPIAAKARTGGLKYKIESGPKGMTVSPEGQVKWMVPFNQALGDTEVIVSLTDGSGQERFHTFTLAVQR